MAFFYVFGGAVFGLVTKPFGSRLILSLWTLGVALFVYRYIQTQLVLRRVMSDMTLVLYRLATYLIVRDGDELAELFWSMRPLDFPGSHRGTLDFGMPRFVVEEFERVSRMEHAQRSRLEIYPLGIFGLAVVVAVILIWRSSLPLVSRLWT